jgi:hypothetical protein
VVVTATPVMAKPDSGNYPLSFTATGNNFALSTDAITALKAGGEITYSYIPNRITVNCNSMRITQLKSCMFGFGIANSSKQSIRSFFATPRYMPSQQLDFYSFPHQPSTTGIQSSLNAPLFNASMISFMFPKRTQDRTCFDNPQYVIQATVNGKNYPDESVSTVGPRFFQQQLVASDLDGPIEPTTEYVESLSEVRNVGVIDEHDSKGPRIYNFPWDTTSFMFNVQLERANAGYCFDGVDSDGQNVSIQLKGTPIAQGDSDATSLVHPTWGRDSYYSFEPWKSTADQVRPQNPEAWICRETYFRLSEREGMVYAPTGIPPNTQIV